MNKKLDIPGIWSEVGDVCRICNPQEKIKLGIRGPGRGDYFCKDLGKDCPFRVTSERGSGSAIAPSSKVFRKYGLKTLKKNSTYIYGKSHFFYFLDHPEENWTTPSRPEKNRFGEVVTETDIQTLAHVNGNHYDDSEKNLEWQLKSEHIRLEPNLKRNKKD